MRWRWRVNKRKGKTMKKWFWFMQFILVVLLLGQTACSSGPQVKFVEGQDKIDVFIADKKITTYLYASDPAHPPLKPVKEGIHLTKPILYPLCSPSGEILTRGYPFAQVEGERQDHLHHMGMYFTLDIGKDEFWGNSKHDLPVIKHIKTTRIQGGSGQGILSVLLHWIAQDGKPMLAESRTMVFRASSASDHYSIDFTISLEALDKTVVFEDNKEGMFSIRVAHWLNEKHSGQYLNSEGEETEENVWGKRARWVRLEGQKDGKNYGIAILNHPGSVNYPTYWHARGYGCFAANPMGQFVFQKQRKVPNPQPLNCTIQKGQSVLSLYRIYVYEGTRNLPQMEKVFKDYTGLDSVIAPGAQVIEKADGFKFTEGPAADAQGNVFFSDIPNNRILKFSTSGKLTTYRENSGGANGLYFDTSGNLLVCEGNNRRVVSLDPQQKVTVLADKYDNKKLNKPNDLWIDPQGGVYFSDPIYGQVDQEQDGQHVYYITPDRKKIIRVIDDYVRPNGLIGTPDGKTLYVTDRGDTKTYSYTINPDGTLSDKKLFAPVGSDGMTLDNEGNLYLTTRSVQVYNSTGTKIDTIELPEIPANVCFGDPDYKTLYITAQTSLYSLRMRVKGAGAGRP